MPGTRTPEKAKDPNVAGKRAELPTLTHLQFLVLDLIRSDTIEVSAQQLQAALSAFGVEQHGPKFYQLMKRLEENGLVKAWQKAFDVGGSEVHRSFYRISKEGMVAWRVTIEFYSTRFQAKNIFEGGERGTP